MVGAHNANSGGYVYVFEQDEGGVDHWGEVISLIGANTKLNDYFGHAVSVSGNTAVIGARFGNDHADTGSGYVFEAL